MEKNWILLSIPFLFNLLSCEGLSMGGNPYEGSHCRGTSRTNAYSYMFFFELDCPFEGKCESFFFFLGNGTRENSEDNCFEKYELTLKTQDTSIIVNSNRRYLLPLTSDGYLHFSLIDEDGVEKKYDFDLSGIIHSFTVRGDSVDVNVMKDCSFKLYSCKKETVYGNNLLNGKYTFSVTDGCYSETSYRCSWHNQSSLGTDDLDIDATIYWK